MIKKADVILCIFIVVVGLAVSFGSLTAGDGAYAVVTVDGEVYGTYSLSEDQEIAIEQENSTNYITIKDGTVSMTYSTCKNQVCVDSGKISHEKDTIACLPNKVVIEVVADKGGDVDVISG